MISPVNTEILERAKNLSQGEKIVINCKSYIEMETTRTSLLRTKKTLEDRGEDLSQVTVSRASSRKAKIYTVLLFKSASIKEATLIKEDGTTEQLTIICQEDPELERICKIMEEEGASSEEISSYRKEHRKNERT